MNRIPKAHYEAHIPTKPDTVRINHTDCPAGEDKRKRLYITKTKSGSVLVWCHNCSGKGYTNVKSGSGYRSYDAVRQRIKERKEKKAVEVDDVSLPNDLNTALFTWPEPAMHWAVKYGISPDDAKRHRIGYSESKRRVVLPVYSQDHDLVGYQTRRVFDDDPGPKYLTVSQSGVTLYFFSKSHDPNTDHTAVIVEDAISAVKVGKIKGFRGVACLGSHMKTEYVSKLATKFENAAVFLDNDNAEVKRNQNKIFRSCQNLFRGDVKLILSDRDPKEHTISELQNLLNNDKEIVRFNDESRD